MISLKNLFVKFYMYYVCVGVTSYAIYFLQLFVLFLKSLTVLDPCDFSSSRAENLCFNFACFIYILVSKTAHEFIKHI